ncbi:hypothetical protein SAMN05421855_10393 [Ulvibacter litoralis]|uniref:Uncharacterized protein n=1 Tax=Ulvibacter litoralis TaxID=227084 RepID=A0A1G7GEV0_9FLAO|nr:hypothetical protein SAMN05421855_10393 [Ulvibacter litoralis]
MFLISIRGFCLEEFAVQESPFNTYLYVSLNK